MDSIKVKDIIKINEEKNFHKKSFSFSITGKYTSSDALFNHRDVPHFNHLHPNLAYGFGNEGLHYGDTASFIRYFKLLGITFPILTLMKNDTKKSVLETFSFFCFYFMKVNIENDLKKNECKSTIVYYIFCKNKMLLFLFTPFFKKMFKKSFNDYKNDDHPFLNRRGYLRNNNFTFQRDNTNFNFQSTINIQKQRCFFSPQNIKKKSIKIDLKEIANNNITKFGDVGILGFQIYKRDNLIQIFHRVCPHEGGDLDINNEVGIKYTIDKFLKNKCRVRCNVHNRLFKPIVTLDLSNKKRIFVSKVFEFELTAKFLTISILLNKNTGNLDWCK